MATIGSVSVDVVPDARNFVTKLRGEILPGADNIGRDFGRKMGDSAGRTGAERINAYLKSNVRDVNINVDTGKARAQIAALGKQIDSLDKSANTRGGRRGVFGSLIADVAALSPLLIPLGAVAAGAFGAFAVGAGVAVLAVKGIQAAMKSGNALGVTYTAQIGLLKGNFDKLAAVSARGVLGGFERSTATIGRLMPQLTAETKLFSGYLGDAGAHVVSGLAGGLVKLQPLFATLLRGADRLAASFDSYANGGGLEKFGNYVQQNLPAVAKAVASVAQAVARLLAAGAGSGVSILSAIGKLADAINAIPMPVLQALVPLVLGTYAAFRAWSLLAPIITGVSTALKGYAVAQLVASGATTEAAASVATAQVGFLSLSSRILPIAGLVGAAAVAWTGYSVAVNAAADSSNKAIASIGRNLKDSGFLHLSNPITAFKDALANKGSAGIAGVTAGNAKAGEAEAALRRQADATRAARVEQNRLNAAWLAATPGATALAGALGLSASGYRAAATAAAQARAAERAQTVQMQLASDAAGLLQSALNKLGGNNLGVAETTTQLAQSQREAARAFHTNGSAIAGTSAKALANQTALQGVARAAIAQAQAIGKNTGSTRAESAALAASRRALLSKLAAQGQLTPAVQRYINTIFKIPPVKQTRVDFLAAAARGAVAYFQARVNALHGKSVSINANTGQAMAALHGVLYTLNGINSKTVTITTLHADGSVGTARAAYATGGLIDGPGTGTSDSVPIWASAGEYVVNARAAAKNRALLDSINGPGTTSGNRYAAGGTVNYELGLPNVRGIISEIRRGTHPAAAAMRALSRAVSDAFRLTGIDKQLNATKAKLTGLIATRNQYGASVRDSVLGKFDPSSAGVDSRTGYVSGVPNILRSFQAAALNTSRIRSYQRTLNAKGLDASLLGQLVQGGDVKQLAALAGGSRSQIRSVNALNARIHSDASAIGRYAGQDAYGAQISAEARNVHSLERVHSKLIGEVRRLVAYASRTADRPVVLTVNGAVMARVVNHENAKAKRR